MNKSQLLCAHTYYLALFDGYLDDHMNRMTITISKDYYNGTLISVQARYSISQA